MTRIEVLLQNPENHSLNRRATAYDGPIRPKVWKFLNREILKCEKAGRFYPLEAIDAYHQVVAELLEKSRDHEQGRLVLKPGCSLETYLTNTARTALLNFLEREVRPAREAYRATEPETSEPDDTDLDIEPEDDDETPTAATPPAEAMPAPFAGETRRKRALFALELICDVLNVLGHENAVTAFAAYIVADGDKVEAAQLIGMSPAWYYRLWPRWIELARKATEDGNGRQN